MTRSKGFTLIELIVSVIILLLLSALMVAGYNGFNSSQTVLQAASTLKNNLRAARTAATSGLKPAGCDTLIGYQVAFPTTSSYTSEALCLVGGTQQSVGVVSPYALPAGVQFNPPAQPIIFYPVGGGVSVAQTIILQGNAKSAFITITLNGSVEDSVSVPTPTPTPTPISVPIPMGGQ